MRANYRFNVPVKKKARQDKKLSREHKCVPKTLTAKNVSLESAGEAVVTHYDLPPSQVEDKKIHPRRQLPPVPNAESDETEESQ